MKKRKKLHKTDKKVERKLGQTKNQLTEYSHRDIFSANKNKRMRSRSLSPHLRSKRNRSYSKKRIEFYTKSSEKSNDHRSRYRGSPISSRESSKKYKYGN